jgi:hypothetical protein
MDFSAPSSQAFQKHAHRRRSIPPRMEASIILDVKELSGGLAARDSALCA